MGLLSDLAAELQIDAETLRDNLTGATGEALVPTYLVANPDGTVTIEWTGSILQLLQGLPLGIDYRPGAGPLPPAVHGWQGSDGILRTGLLGDKITAANDPNNTSGAGGARMQAFAGTDAQGHLQNLVSIIQENGFSNFVKYHGTDASQGHGVDIGVQNISWPGGANDSFAATVNHGLQVVPTGVLLCCLTDVQVPVMRVVNGSRTNTQFQMRGWAVNGQPANGTTAPILWVAFGDGV